MYFLMIKKLVDVFECFPTLVEEARVLVTGNFIFQDVRVIGSSKRHLDGGFFGLTGLCRWMLNQNASINYKDEI